MPINCRLKLHSVSDADFEATDWVVMGSAFASQNELGRLCDERVYEKDIVARLRARGITDVFTQEPIVVS